MGHIPVRTLLLLVMELNGISQPTVVESEEIVQKPLPVVNCDVGAPVGAVRPSQISASV